MSRIKRCPKCDRKLIADLLRPDKPPMYCWKCDKMWTEAEITDRYLRAEAEVPMGVRGKQ